MFRTCIRTFDQRVLIETKTNTNNQLAAAEAFAELVNRQDLDGQKFAAALTYNNVQLAFHRFDKAPGGPNYWRGRLDEIEWPDTPVIGPGAGGARAGAGRKTQTTDGGPLRRSTVNLDETSISLLTALGGGELSEGIRRAARLAALAAPTGSPQ